MIEIIVMIIVVVWFWRMARVKGKSGLSWAVLGAISFYGPVWVSIWILTKIMPPSTTTVIIKLLLSYGIGIFCCIFARHKLLSASSTDIEHTIAALRDEKAKVRRVAVEALYRVNDPRVVEPLVAALQDEDYVVRGNAARALSCTKDPRAVEALIVALKDENADVRRNATESLGVIEDERTVHPLVSMLEDNDFNVRGYARKALKGKTKQDFGEDGIRWEEWLNKKKEIG